MTWTNLSFAFGSTLTSTKMTQMDDNFDALMAKDPGAPVLANNYLTAAMAPSGGWAESTLAATSVSQSKLKTALQTMTVGTGTGDSSNTFVLSGGRYCFVTTAHLDVDAATKSCWLLGGSMAPSGLSNAITPLEASVGVTFTAEPTARGSEKALLTVRTVTNTVTHYFYSLSISSSPPYDLGDGEVPTFTFLVIDNTTGRVEMMSDCVDPPWANNGPTVISPLARLVRLAGESPLLRDVVNNAGARAARVARLRAAHRLLHSTDPTDQTRVREILETPITQEEKQRDMPLIPHPFGHVRAGKTVVLLDPVGPIAEELFLEKTYGGGDIGEIVMGDKLIIDNTPSGAISPPGVMAVRARWKLTP